MRPLTRQLVAVAGQGVIPAGRPIATADDVGLVRGDGCFDAMRVLNLDGRAVAEHLDEHLARFERSMTRLELPFDEPGWRALIADALQAWTHPPSEAVLTAIAESDFETWRIDAFVEENFDYVDTGSTDRVIDWLILGEPPQPAGPDADRQPAADQEGQA